MGTFNQEKGNLHLKFQPLLNPEQSLWCLHDIFPANAEVKTLFQPAL